MHVIIYGDLRDGFVFIGPFNDSDSALTYAGVKCKHRNWRVCEMDKPLGCESSDPSDSLTVDQKFEIECAHTDLSGTLQAYRDGLLKHHDWSAIERTIQKLEQAFSFLKHSVPERNRRTLKKIVKVKR